MTSAIETPDQHIAKTPSYHKEGLIKATSNQKVNPNLQILTSPETKDRSPAKTDAKTITATKPEPQKTLTPQTVTIAKKESEIKTASPENVAKIAPVLETKKSAPASLALSKENKNENYKIEYGIPAEQIENINLLITEKFLSATPAENKEKDAQKILDSIKNTFLTKTEMEGKIYYVFNEKIIHAPLNELLDKLPILSPEQKSEIQELLTFLYNSQITFDVEETLAKISEKLTHDKMFDKNGKLLLTKEIALSYRYKLDAVLTFLNKNNPSHPDVWFNEQKNNNGNNIGKTMEQYAIKMKSWLQLEKAETLKKQLNYLLYEDNLENIYETANDRIAVINGDASAPKTLTFKDDSVDVKLTQKQAVLKNNQTGLTARLAFNQAQETEIEPDKILFKDSEVFKQTMLSLGINLEEYPTITNFMPYIKYRADDQNISETEKIGKLIESLKNLFTGQKNLHPNVHRHLNELEKFNKSSEKLNRFACQAAIAALMLYAALRVVGVASVMALADGNLAILERFGAMALFIGEFTVRWPASRQYNRIIYNTLSKDTEGYNATQKELDEVRGEHGPTLGFTHYFYKEDTIMKGTLETSFLTSTGYWNFTAHHYNLGWTEKDNKELIDKDDSWKNQKKQLEDFVANLNHKVKKNWIQFEDNLVKTFGKNNPEKNINDVLNINLIKIPENVSEKNLELLKQEYKNLSDVYKSIAEEYHIKEEFWRTRTKERVRHREKNALWFDHIADIWGANAKTFENKIKELEFSLHKINNTKGQEKNYLMSSALLDIRKEYRYWEHAFHHKVIFTDSQRYRRFELSSYENIEKYFKDTLTSEFLNAKVKDVLKDREALKEFTKILNNSLKYFNRDLIIATENPEAKDISKASKDLEKTIISYTASLKEAQISDILPQLILDHFSKLHYDCGGKQVGQDRLYEHFSKTFYLAKTATGKTIEFPKDTFNGFCKKYLNKAGFSQKEWANLTDEEWLKLGELAKFFPQKPERREYPKTRFNYSLDKDHFPHSVNPASLKQEDVSSLVAYMLRLQKKGEANVSVIQTRQNYLYDNEYEKLSGAANNDQKPWYGSFIMQTNIEKLLSRLQNYRQNLTESIASSENLKILREVFFLFSEEDKKYSMHIMPVIADALVSNSEKGLTHEEIEKILLNQNINPETQEKISYELLNKWLGNLYHLILDLRKTAGMATGKDIDDAMFNCGTCRLEDIQLSRLGLEQYQIMHPNKNLGKETKHKEFGAITNNHATVILSNETGDIQEYLVRTGTKVQKINAFVDLDTKNNTEFLQLLKNSAPELFQDINAAKLERKEHYLVLYDASGKIIHPEYKIKIINKPNHLIPRDKREKIFIYQPDPDGKIKPNNIKKVIYQYHKISLVSDEELESILGLQETRPGTEIGIVGSKTIKMQKNLKGVFVLKHGFENLFEFDKAIESEADLDALKNRFSPEVIKEFKKLFQRQQKSKEDIGTVIEDYTPSGKIITDFIPGHNNTRYLTSVNKEHSTEILNHTMGSVDITTAQIIDLLDSLKIGESRNIIFPDGKILIKRENQDFSVSITKNGQKNLYELKGNVDSYALLHNGKEKSNYPANNSSASACDRYYAGGRRSLAKIIKQNIEDKEFQIDYGKHAINSATFAKVLNNPALYNRTIYLGNTNEDQITVCGSGRHNLRFPAKNAFLISSSNYNEKVPSQTQAQENAFWLDFLRICAQNVAQKSEKNTPKSNNGDKKIGGAFQKVLIKNNNRIVHDLDISFIENKGKHSLYIYDKNTDENLIIPYNNSLSSKNMLQQKSQTNEISHILDKLKSWCAGNEIEAINLSTESLQEMLTTRFGSKEINIRKSRDRSNLALMLLHIKQLAPTGEFTFKKVLNNEEKIYHLIFNTNRNSRNVVLNDKAYNSYEAAINDLDELLFNDGGIITVQSRIIIPRVETKLVKTDDKGNILFEEELSVPKQAMPDWWITEDAASTWEQHRRGLQVRYAPFNCADGVGPECMSDLITQHKRWALGTMDSFRYEDLHKDKMFMNTNAGKQLEQNRKWYAHGPYDEGLFNAPVALANAYLIGQKFNPLAADSSNLYQGQGYGLDSTPFSGIMTGVIVSVGLASTLANILVYFNDMHRQNTSIKDLFLKESLIGFLGANSYTDALESHISGLESTFEITAIGEARKPINYAHIKATNARLAKSIYAFSVFTALYWNAIATQGLGAMVSPFAFTCGLVGFWSALNAAKLLTGIYAFDGVKNYWNDWWRAGFYEDAGNKTMENYNDSAKSNTSLNSIEKVLIVTEQRFNDRLARGLHGKSIQKPDYANLSFALDTTLKILNEASITNEERIKGLYLLNKIYSLVSLYDISTTLLEQIYEPNLIKIDNLKNIFLNDQIAAQIFLSEFETELSSELKSKLAKENLTLAQSLKNLATLDTQLHTEVINELAKKLEPRLKEAKVIDPEGHLLSLQSAENIAGPLNRLKEVIKTRLSHLPYDITSLKQTLAARLNDDPKTKTLVTANGRTENLFKLIHNIKNHISAFPIDGQAIKNSPELNLLTAKTYAKVQNYSQSLSHIYAALQNLYDIPDEEKRSLVYLQISAALAETYQLISKKDKEFASVYTKLSEEAIFQNKSSAQIQKEILAELKLERIPAEILKNLQPLYELKEKSLWQETDLRGSERMYNIKRYNQAKILFDLYQSTKEKTYLEKAYTASILITECSTDMENTKADILLTLTKAENNPELQTSLLSKNLDLLNNKLKTFFFTDEIKLDKDSLVKPEITINQNRVYTCVSEFINALNKGLKYFSKTHILNKVTNLDEAVKILSNSNLENQILANAPITSEKLLNARASFLEIARILKNFIPDLTLVSINNKSNITITEIENVIKENINLKYLELKALIKNLSELADKDTYINLVRNHNSAKGIEELEIKLSFQKIKKATTENIDEFKVTFVPAKPVYSVNEEEIWSGAKDSQEPDLYLRNQKMLIRRIMAINGHNVPGLKEKTETKIAKSYNLQKDEKTVDHNFARPEQKANYLITENLNELVTKTTSNIIDRLIELGRYDEAARYFSYFVPTAKIEGKNDVENIGEFIESAYGLISEEDLIKEILPKYASFLTDHGDKLAVDEKNRPLSFKKAYKLTEAKIKYREFMRTQGDTSSEEKIKASALNFVKNGNLKTEETKKIVHEITVKEELQKVLNLMSNLMAEKIGAKQLLEETAKIKNQNKKTRLKILENKKDLASLEQLLNENDPDKDLQEIISFLLGQKANPKPKLTEALTKIKSTLNNTQLLQLLSLYTDKIVSQKNPAVSEQDLKNQLELYINNLLSLKESSSNEDMAKIEALFHKYLTLTLKEGKLDLSLIQPVYNNLFNRNPAESCYLQKLTLDIQNQLEKELNSEILILKGKTEKEIPASLNDFNKTLAKFISYTNLLTGSSSEINTEDKTLSALLNLANISKSIGSLKITLIENLKELLELANIYKIDKAQCALLKNACDAICKKADASNNLSNIILASEISIKAASLEGNAANLLSAFNKTLNKIGSAKNLSQKEKIDYAWNSTTIFYYATLDMLNNPQTSNSEKIKALGYGLKKLSEPIFPDEYLNWEQSLLGFELRAKFSNLIKNNAFSESEIASLRSIGLLKEVETANLTNYALSALTAFSQKISAAKAQGIIDKKEHAKKESVFNIYNRHKFDTKFLHTIECYQRLEKHLREIVIKENLTPIILANSQTFDPLKKQAANYLAAAVSKKTVSFSNAEKKLFASNPNTGFDPQNFLADTDKIKLKYNGLNPAANQTPAPKTKPAQPTSRINLWLKQKSSAISRKWDDFKHHLKHDKWFFMHKIVNHVTLWGSIGAITAALALLIFPPLGSLMGGTVVVYSAAIVLSSLIGKPILNLFSKLFWKIYGSFRAYKDKKNQEENSI